jgi:hypothetical protein
VKSGDEVGAMPTKLAAEGASGGALGGASRSDLSRGYTRLDEAESPDPFMSMFPGESSEAKGKLHEGPTNEIFTEHDAGGFLKRPHGLER